MANILLLEPDAGLADSYAQAFAAADHQVFWRTDAQAALAVIDDHAPALVVLELHLPKHNGVEFLYEIRSYPDCDDIPVLLHTNVPQDHPGIGRDYWPQLGIHDYLYKPETSLDELVKRALGLMSPARV